MYRKGLDEAVNAVGIALIPGADDQFMRGNDRNGNVIERVDIRRGSGDPPGDIHHDIRVNEITGHGASRLC
jgi:hypothetical protein